MLGKSFKRPAALTAAVILAALVIVLAVVKLHGGKEGAGEAGASASPAASASAQAAGAAYTLQLDAAHPSFPVSPSLFGAFFEEINHAGDGGLYAELVNNRSFEDDDLTPVGWTLEQEGSAAGTMDLESANLLNAFQKHALVLKVDHAGAGERIGVSNDGYWGISVKKGATYTANFYVKAEGALSGKGLQLSLESGSGSDAKVLASTDVLGLSSSWNKLTGVLKPDQDADEARLVIRVQDAGTLHLDVVSLFPETWKGRANGLRQDLAEKVQAMEPKFVRFPGGCFVEGLSPEDSYKWKTTIGDIAERPGHPGMWGYNSTDGLGFHEYLQWAEDLGAEPLYVVNVGISHPLGVNLSQTYSTVPIDQLQPYVEDVLDAIEYANGPATSTWGAKRAANGHPEPFHLKYIEIGNENNFQMSEYVQRYPIFYKAIKEKYPEIVTIANAAVPSQPLDLVDEHYYNPPEWFLANANRYDSYDRNGPKVYVGEYAVTTGAGMGNLHAAIGEAAFMTGMERNSDVVKMASYAPLFVNDNNRAWNPDAIVFNAKGSYGTPSYYVQSLFGKNQGDQVLPVRLTGSGSDAQAEAPAVKGGIGLGSWATQVEYKDLKVVGADGKTLAENSFQDGSSLDGWLPQNGDWSLSEGTYRQTGTMENARTTFDDASWHDYTMTVKARKTGGSEGMLILFGVQDSDTYYWWNIGGWGNSQHAIEKSVKGSKSMLGQAVSGSVETGKWMDIKVEVSGSKIRCYLDGQLVQETEEAAPAGPLFYSAMKDQKTGEVIVKIVNSSDKEQKVKVQLDEGQVLAGGGKAWVMSGDDLMLENTFDEPERIAPKEVSLGSDEGKEGSIVYACPKYSVSVVRLPLKK